MYTQETTGRNSAVDLVTDSNFDSSYRRGSDSSCETTLILVLK